MFSTRGEKTEMETMFIHSISFVQFTAVSMKFFIRTRSIEVSDHISFTWSSSEDVPAEAMSFTRLWSTLFRPLTIPWSSAEARGRQGYRHRQYWLHLFGMRILWSKHPSLCSFSFDDHHRSTQVIIFLPAPSRRNGSLCSQWIDSVLNLVRRSRFGLEYPIQCLALQFH